MDDLRIPNCMNMPHDTGFKIIIRKVLEETKEYFIFLKLMVDKGGVTV